MKIIRTAVNFALISAVVCLLAVIMIPLFAQVQFDLAEKLITKYLWKDAEAKLELAIKISPYDSRYPASMGEFLFAQAGYKDNRTPLLKKAEEYYRRAAGLNPRCAEYFVKMGQIYVSLFMEGPGSRVRGPGLTEKTYIAKAFENFKKAIENDPNGFNTAYAVGYAGLSVWRYLDDNEKAVVIDRLKYSLKQRPWYSKYIRPRVLKETGNSALLGPVPQKVKK